MTVVPHRPWHRAAICLAGLLVVTILLWQAYRSGFERGAENLAELNLAHSQGLSDVQRSSSQLAQLRAALAVAERNRQVDEQVNAQAQASIAALRTKVATLERDVALYRQVMALESEGPELTLQSWQLSRTELPDHYRYRAVLAHTGADGGALSGRLKITVTGAESTGSPQEPDRETEQQIELAESVELRYLQVLEGDVIIPSGFVARRVNLGFEGSPSSTVSFSESMPWQPEGEN